MRPAHTGCMSALPAFDPADHPRGTGGRFTHTTRASSGLNLAPSLAEDPTDQEAPADIDTLGAIDLTFHAGDLPVPDTEFVSAHLPYDADPVNPSLVNFDDFDPYLDTHLGHPGDPIEDYENALRLDEADRERELPDAA